MSNYLLGEFRHCHGHASLEKRLYVFTRVGHVDTWMVNKLQNICLRNSNARLYPGWSNASDNKVTDESFDNIALNIADLHEALTRRWAQMDQKEVFLTRDQKHLANSQ